MWLLQRLSQVLAMLLAQTERVESCRLVTTDSAVWWPGKSSWSTLVSGDGWLDGWNRCCTAEPQMQEAVKGFFSSLNAYLSLGSCEKNSGRSYCASLPEMETS